MKKSLLYLFMLVCSMSMFTSCSDDDDDVKYPVDSELAGAYKGKMDVYYVGVSTPIASDMVQKVYISKASDTAIKLELKNFVINVAGTDITIGDIAVDNCALKQDGEAFQFSGSQTLELVVGSCNTSVSGTIGNGTIDMVINVDVAGGMKVKVNYKGNRLSGNENGEAKITGFTFESELITMQPVIDEDAKTITFKVSENATTEDLQALVPTITVSDKATITPGSGVAQDFTGKVVYTVTAEDGTVVKYSVSLLAKEGIYDFETWVEDQDYHYLSPSGSFGTTNGGSAFVYNSLEGIHKDNPQVVVPPYCVVPTEEAKVGTKAAHLETISLVQAKADLKEYGGFVGGIMSAMCPNITAGSVFLGTFKLDNISKPLTATKFGVLSSSGKPVSFSGWYKYTPGEKFYDANGKELNETDQCAIYAILYEAKDAEGNDITLNGETVNDENSPIVLRADLESGVATNGWKSFNIEFVSVGNRVYEASKEYKLAFVATSSKRGDLYEGAPGSILLIDDFKIEFK